jgi:hypothetical protein
MDRTEKLRFSIGLSIDLHRWLEQKAKKEDRSLAGTVSAIIRQVKEREEQKEAA